MSQARKGLLFAVVVLLVLLVAAGSALAARPTKVVIITMDQMRPDYAKMYNMKNLLWLENHGANFQNAYVGQMASETVVSHNTIVSGLFPKHMGWSDEVMRDSGNVLGYGAGAILTTGDLSYAEYVKLVEAEGYPKLGDYMHMKFPTTIVANFGEKGYQVKSLAASSSDYWVTFSGKKNVSDLPAGTLPWTGKYRMPEKDAVLDNVPAYILNDDRFKISSGNDSDKYGTNVDKPAWLYPEDGRYAPGDPAVVGDHVSGDAWVADAAIKVIQNENWSALHLNFSGIDKIGHMWGGGGVDTIANYKWDPNSLMNTVHMPWIAKNADDQLGKVIAAIKAKGQWKQTLVVVLADHGSTYSRHAYYVDEASGGDASWYYNPNNQSANTAYGLPGANNEAILGPLNATGNVAYSYQSTAIETWLIDRSWAKKAETAQVMKGMPGVIATYVRWGDRYVLASKNRMTKAERTWWAAHGQELVDTMASPTSADVVGLLKNKTGYGVYGDHGGAQMDVQRIPMVMYVKGMKHVNSMAQFRLVDVLPTVLRNMGIGQMAPMDGKAYKLPL